MNFESVDIKEPSTHFRSENCGTIETNTNKLKRVGLTLINCSQLHDNEAT